MKILIIDDHAIVREGIAAMLLQEVNAATILEAGDGAEGLAIADAHSDIDAVLLDLEMPGLGGRPALEEFGKRHPDLPVIILSSSVDHRDVRQALASGALGYVPKSATAKTLLAAIRLVLQGDIYVPPLVLDPKFASLHDAPNLFAAEHLTERQIEVLELIGEGKSNKEISIALGLAEKTVKVHITAIFKALGVTNRVQAINAAKLAGPKRSNSS